MRNKYVILLFLMPGKPRVRNVQYIFWIYGFLALKIFFLKRVSFIKYKPNFKKMFVSNIFVLVLFLVCAYFWTTWYMSPYLPTSLLSVCRIVVININPLKIFTSYEAFPEWVLRYTHKYSYAPPKTRMIEFIFHGCGAK